MTEFNTQGAETGRWKRSDRQELEILRVSLARIAQAVGVETPKLPVIEKSSLNELAQFAKQDRGWNALAGAIVEKLSHHVMIDKYETQEIIEALRTYGDQMMVGDGTHSEYLHGIQKRLEDICEERRFTW